MNNELKIKMYSFTMDCQNALELAEFYAKLLNWSLVYHDDDWAVLGAPNTEQGGYPGLVFQSNPDYQPPVWPANKDEQQQMAHLDLAVNDLDEAVAYALECGAIVATEQFLDNQMVMIDPAGHPFCLCMMKELIENINFALL